jgi:NTE family protein
MTAPSPAGAPGAPVALVHGSGSVKCAAALGLYRLLRREGIGVDLVVGCSGGALFATGIALGMPPEEMMALAQRLFTREATSRPDRAALLRAMFPRLFGFTEEWGTRDDRPLGRALASAFGERTIADAVVPLHIAATDFHTGEQVVLSQGRLVDAIRASIAIPFLFRPWRVDGRLLADGFLSDPLPVGVAIREGASVIVAMGFESPYQTRMRSAGRYAFQVSSIMTNNLLRAAFSFHGLAHHSEVIPVLPRFKERVGLFETAKIPYVVDEGERAMAEQLPYLRRLLAAQTAAGPVTAPGLAAPEPGAPIARP